MYIKILFFTLLSIQLFGQANISVDHYSGRANVNIPIAVVTDRNLSHSISLNYRADAVKVDDIADWTSTHWTLVAGGEVKRILKGLPDDYTSSDSQDLRRGWLFDSNPSSSTNATYIGNYTFPAEGSGPASCSPANIYNDINAFNHNVDTEPDEFNFSAGGISGVFVFDNTGSITSIKTIPYQDIRINAIRTTPTSPISSFEIITPSGTKYIFSTQETTTKTVRDAPYPDLLHFRKEYYWYKTPLQFTTSWKLTRIESHLGEHIDFTYITNTKETSTPVNVAIFDPNQVSFPHVYNQYSIVETLNGKFISEINTTNEKIVFNSNFAQRPGINPNGVLKSIVINSVSNGVLTWVKTYWLQHVGYNSADSEVGSTYNRYFLRRLDIETPCDYEQAYLFTYNEPTKVQSPNSVAKDIWGYSIDNYSGSHPYPKLYVYPSFSGFKKISLFRILDDNDNPYSDEIEILGTNRIPNGTPIYGSLTKVTYLSGSSDNFVYEPHDFNNPINGKVSIGGGLRIKEITKHDNVTNQYLTRTFQYKKASENKSSGVLIALPAFWMINGFYKQPLAPNSNGPVQTFSFDQLSSLSNIDKWNRLIVRTKDNIHPDLYAVDSPIAYETVTETLSTGNGKTVYEFDIPYKYGSMPDLNWTPTYINVAANNTSNGNCVNTGFNVPGFYVPNFVQQTPINFRRGLLNKVSVYKENDNVAVKEITYSYQDKTISGSTVIGLDYEFIPYSNNDYYFLFGAYKLMTNTTRILQSKMEKIRDEIDPTKSITSTTSFLYGSNHTFISEISTSNSDGTQTITRNRYVKDYGVPSSITSDLQVNMIDALNTLGRIAELVEQVNYVIPPGAPGGSEKAISASLTLFDNFGTSGNMRILPKQQLSVDVDNGISSFSLSSFSGSGASRTFSKNGAYRAFANFKFNDKGDLIKQENTKRQVQGFHYEKVSGIAVASISMAQPEEVVYSNFDNETDYSFEIFGFSAVDKSVAGKHATNGLGGFTNESTRYLKKQFKRKPNSKYTFSAWYSPSVTTGTHTLSLIIKDLSNTQLQQHTVDFTVAAGTTWFYAEKVVDLSTLTQTDLIIEIRFSGSSGTSAVVDELLFYPVAAEVVRSSFKAPLGQLSATGVDGRMVQYERDKNGRLRLVRDHENNIIQKIDYNRKDEVTSYYKIVVPTEIYVNELASLRGLNRCKDIETLEWKVTLKSNPSGGTYVQGAELFTYTFPTVAEYIVFARFSHPTYGVTEMQTTVNVLARDLTLTICQEGARRINVCGGGTITHGCTGGAEESGETDYTTYKVTPTGCEGGIYTYNWQIKYDNESIFKTAQLYHNSDQISILNDRSYEIKCYVTSSCGASGISESKSFILYSNPINCSSGGWK